MPDLARPKCQPQRGRRPVPANCTLAELSIDPSYQRSIDTGPSRALIREIAATWDWGLCQLLVVSQRADAGLFIVDGQHRWMAARLRGDILDLPCVIHRYASVAEEAESFVRLNRRRKPIAALELFRAELASGNPDAAAVMTLVEQSGLALAPHTNPLRWRAGEVANIAGLTRSYRAHGPDVTGRALNLIAGAFAGQVMRYAGTIFAGLVPVLAELGEAADDELIEAVLGACTQAEWIEEFTRVEAAGVPRVKAAQQVLRAAIDEAAEQE